MDLQGVLIVVFLVQVDHTDPLGPAIDDDDNLEDRRRWQQLRDFFFFENKRYRIQK
mgnify:CR=1 FL=1